MASKFYFGSGLATPGIVKEVEVPMPGAIQKRINSSNYLIEGNTVIDLTGVVGIGTKALANAYTDNLNITGKVDNLKNIKYINGSSACRNTFANCGITEIDLSSLELISGEFAAGNMFYKTRISTIEFPALTTISGYAPCYYMFESSSYLVKLSFPVLNTISGGTYCCQSLCSQCTNKLKTVEFPALVTINSRGGFYQAFQYCYVIESINFDSLTTLDTSDVFYEAFKRCNALSVMKFKSLSSIKGSSCLYRAFTEGYNNGLKNLYFYALNNNSFGSYTNQFSNMLSSTNNCIVHFPKIIKSTIENWTDIVNGFNGTNTVIEFDLNSSLIGADTNTYIRSEKDSTDTATAWSYNNILYYTAGTTELTDLNVGDNIYSDSECTQVVTTINAIA